jgi:hypothetical protein
MVGGGAGGPARMVGGGGGGAGPGLARGLGRGRARGGGSGAGRPGRRGDPSRAGGHPRPLPDLVPGRGPDLPGALLGGARGDRHDGIEQRPVQCAWRAQGQEPHGRRGADAVRAGHVRRIRRPGRPVRQAHPVQSRGRDLHRRPDAVRRRRRGRVVARASAGDLRLQPCLLVRHGRTRHRRPVHGGRAAPSSSREAPAPTAPEPPAAKESPDAQEPPFTQGTSAS